MKKRNFFIPFIFYIDLQIDLWYNNYDKLTFDSGDFPLLSKNTREEITND